MCRCVRPAPATLTLQFAVVRAYPVYQHHPPHDHLRIGHASALGVPVAVLRQGAVLCVERYLVLGPCVWRPRAVRPRVYSLFGLSLKRGYDQQWDRISDLTVLYFFLLLPISWGCGWRRFTAATARAVPHVGQSRRRSGRLAPQPCLSYSASFFLRTPRRVPIPPTCLPAEAGRSIPWRAALWRHAYSWAAAHTHTDIFSYIGVHSLTSLISYPIAYCIYH